MNAANPSHKSYASDKSNLSDERRRLIPKYGGYRKLRSFQTAQLVYDGTVVFCDRFIDKRSRTHDQMVQAARSGVQAKVLQVLGIFFGSRASKYAWETRQKHGEADSGRERLVLDLLADKGQVTRRDVMEKLGVSDNTANRLLQALEARKLVRRMGERRGSYYVLP